MMRVERNCHLLHRCEPHKRPPTERTAPAPVPAIRQAQATGSNGADHFEGAWACLGNQPFAFFANLS
jgi:hypothetical protein